MSDKPGVSSQEFKDWLCDVVANEIQQVLDRNERRTNHLGPEDDARLQWVAEHFIPADPDSLKYTDGPPGDAGLDVVHEDPFEHETVFHIYQVYVPSLNKLERGQLGTAGGKLEEDLRHLHKVLAGTTKIKKRQLNEAAESMLARINHRIDNAKSDPQQPAVRLVIHPILLAALPQDKLEAYKDLQVAAREQWNHDPRVTWELQEPLTALELRSLHINKKPKELPVRLDLMAKGGFARPHAERGPWLFFATATPILDAYDHFQAGLFDANLRYYLGKKTDVNKKILGALARPSGLRWFHASNNGLVITSTHVTPSGEKIVVQNPQVINGGQTIVTLADERRRIRAKNAKDRDEKEKDCLKRLDEELLLPIKIVVEKDQARVDEIAIASNTQNALSPRTLCSTREEMRLLRFALAGLTPPWFLEIKDGEWSAIKKQKDIVQARTRRSPHEFGSGRTTRLLENTELGVALFAAYGCVEDAKSSRVFKEPLFSSLFGSRPRTDSWKELTSNRVQWGSNAQEALFEQGMPLRSFSILAYSIWSFWKKWTFPDSEQERLAYEERGTKNPKFREEHFDPRDGWTVPDQIRATVLENTDSCYWIERVLKASYLVMIHQTVRVLFRLYGPLNEGTASAILNFDQFKALAAGETAASLGDFRQGKISDGPMTTIGLILRHAAKGLWNEYGPQIQSLVSPQQELLTDTWVRRLNDEVDRVLEHFPRLAERLELLPSGEKMPETLQAAFPALRGK
jgi:hypothetical protein